MLLAVSLYDLIKKQKANNRSQRKWKPAGISVSFFRWANIFYAGISWLESKLIPRSIATILLIKAEKLEPFLSAPSRFQSWLFFEVADEHPQQILLACITHETVSRDREDALATGKPYYPRPSWILPRSRWGPRTSWRARIQKIENYNQISGCKPQVEKTDISIFAYSEGIDKCN